MSLFHMTAVKVKKIMACLAVVSFMGTPAYAGADDASDLRKVIDNMGRNGVVSKKIIIDIDFTEGFLLSRPAGQIVLGNPLIADIKVQDDRQLFLIGKSPGRTNMLVYGRDGQLQERHTLMVRDPNTYVTYFKGSAERLHYDCLPDCQRVLRIQDEGPGYGSQMDKILNHMQQIDSRADSAAAQETPLQNQQIR